MPHATTPLPPPPGRRVLLGAPGRAYSPRSCDGGRSGPEPDPGSSRTVRPGDSHRDPRQDARPLGGGGSHPSRYNGAGANAVNIDVSLTDEDIDRIGGRTVSMLAGWREHGTRRLDVGQAADHLCEHANACRALVKRRRIPFHRTENGRLRFSVTELDHWVRTGSCAATHEDLP